MNKHIYRLLQCTWGLPQTLVGLGAFLANLNRPHYNYNGAIATEWNKSFGASFGMFIFISDEQHFAYRYKSRSARISVMEKYLVHEFGHTFQSLMLGPLYLPAVAVPSAMWAFLPSCRKKRAEKKMTYSDFFTEKWADMLGEKKTGQRSITAFNEKNLPDTPDKQGLSERIKRKNTKVGER